MKRLLFFLFLVAGAIVFLRAAPPAPASNTFLADARQASGGDAWEQARSLAAAGTIESSGMVGKFREVVDLKSARMMRSEDAGIVRTLHVWNGADHWRQKSSGGFHALNSDFERENAITDEWLAQRSYLRPDAGGASLSEVKRQTDAAATFAVMTARPKGGQPVDLWFDATSHVLARTVRQQNLNIETIRYGEYRPVDGVKLPFTITIDDGDPASLETIRISSYAFNAASEADFQKPRRQDDSSMKGVKETVPIEFDGDLMVQAKINDQGPFGFILDTGGHDILTPEAAKTIGLTLEGAGRSGGAGEGTVSEQYTRVSRMDIGGMTMRDQVFTVIPLNYPTVEQGSKPPLAGILGMEIFERFAMRIDYRAKTLTLEPLETYAHSGPGKAVPIFFNDDEPLIKGKLNGHAGGFGIDTGNSGSMVVQGHWAEREGLIARLKSGLDVASFGMGGISHNWASRVDVEIAGTQLRNVIARLATDKAGAFASVVEATNIGNEILANFRVDFDYARNQLWLEPVPGFVPQPFSRAGLSASKTRPDVFTIVQVSDKTPAADAGLQVGDEITAVDGVPAREMSSRDLFRAMRKAPGTKVALSIVHKGDKKSATLVLRELLP